VSSPVNLHLFEGERDSSPEWLLPAVMYEPLLAAALSDCMDPWVPETAYYIYCQHYRRKCRMHFLLQNGEDS